MATHGDLVAPKLTAALLTPLSSGFGCGDGIRAPPRLAVAPDQWLFRNWTTVGQAK
jgi:hypothetical protein